jgi:hypothetical protein
VHAYLTTHRTIALVIAGVTFAMFLPTVILPYAFADDYSILWMAVSGKPSIPLIRNILEWDALGGRPVAGVLTQWTLQAAGTIENLRFVRLIGLVGMVILALLLHWALTRAGFRSTVAALIALLVCSLPAFQVFVAYTELYVAPIATILAAAASILIVTTLDGSRKLATDRPLRAAALLLVALTIYQPAAMFFWVFLAIAVAGARDEPGGALALVRAHAGVGIVALACEFLVTRIAIHFLAHGADYTSTAGAPYRTTLTHDPVGKVRWFFEQPLYRSLNLFDLTPSSWLAALVAVIAVGGIVVWLLYWSVRPFLYIAVGLVLVPLSYLPNLLTIENAATYRTQVALSALITLYVCFGAVGLWVTLRESVRDRISVRASNVTQRIGLALAGLVVFGGVVSAMRNVTDFFAESQMTELRLVKGQVAAVPAGAPRIGFVATPSNWGLTDLVIGDEFGLPTTAQTTVLRPLVLILLHEEGRLPRDSPLPTVDILPLDTTTYPSGEPVIDVRKLRLLR